jgi:hypothetical protein
MPPVPGNPPDPGPVSGGDGFEPDNEEHRRLGELADLVKSTLGGLDEQSFESLSLIQNWLRDYQGKLVLQLREGVINPEEYHRLLGEALNKSMRDCRKVLGDKQFKLLFGPAGETPEGLVDKDIFFRDVKG